MRIYLIGFSIFVIAIILPFYDRYYKSISTETEINGINAVGDALRKNPEYLEYISKRC